jgi:hypothetical protein
MNRRTPSVRFRPTFSLLEARDNPASLFTASGAAAGGLPLVEVDRPDGTTLARFEAFEPGFTGGVRAAVGELDGNTNTVEVVAAAGPGGGPRVRVFSVDINTGAVTSLVDTFVFEPSFRDGVRVAVGQIGGGPLDRIVLGTDPGGGPRVRLLQLQLAGLTPTLVPAGGPLDDFFAFEPGFRGGVRVAAGDVDGNPSNGDELIVGAGVGGGPRVIAFRADGSVAADFFALPPSFTGGVNVSVVNGQVVADGLASDVTQRNVLLNAVAGVTQRSGTPNAAAAVPAAVFVPPTTTESLQAGNPAPGSSSTPSFVAPGLVFGSPFTLPLLMPTPLTTGMPFGTAATAPGVFNTTTTVPFGTAATAPGVFNTTTGPIGTAITGPGVFATTTTFPVGTAATGPGVFATTTTAPIGTAITGPGVFSNVGGVGF